MSEAQDPARRILESYRNFAVVGCSPNPGRPSHQVAAFLQGLEVVMDRCPAIEHPRLFGSSGQDR